MHIPKKESETIEFKSSFGREAIESLSAFANTKGGTVYVGISDYGEIEGVTTGLETVNNWVNEVKQKTEPSIVVDTEQLSVNDKTIIVFSVKEFPVKPVAFQGRYYKRITNSNHLMGVSEVAELYMQSIQSSWDSYLFPSAKLEDIDTGKVEAFIKKVNDNGRFYLKGTASETLKKLRMVDKGVPTNAAMILFSKENIYNNVHAGRFKTPSIIIDDKMIRGNLYDVVEETIKYILANIKVAFEITGQPERNEIFEYPLPAIRELILNALVHRDYTSPVDVQIKIFDKRISFFNPGRLFGGLTIEDLKTDNYQSQTRNKLISEAFYLTKDIEKYGSGFIRIRKEISHYPTMKFHYEEVGSGFLAELSYTKQKISKDVGKDGGLNGGLNGGINGGISGGISGGINELISIIRTNPGIQSRQIRDSLKVSQRTLERMLKKLKDEKIIEFQGPLKTGGYYLR